VPGKTHNKTMDSKTLCSLILEVSKDLNEDVEWIRSQVYYDICDLDVKEIETYVREVIDKRLLGWSHAMFKKIKDKQQEHDEYLLNPFEVEEGVVQCPKCSSFKVYSYSMQLRAADEPMTTMAECTQCKLKWSQNG